MKERPILFNGEMVQAILDGRKGNTRRVIKPQPPRAWKYAGGILKPDGNVWGSTTSTYTAKCPYGQIGDRLWVRETCQFMKGADCRESYIGTDMEHMLGSPPHYAYRATEPEWGRGFFKWRPSIHMPRWASRILLEITDIRVERVQEISKANVFSEGICFGLAETTEAYLEGALSEQEAKHEFAHLWDSINAKRGYGWDVNPWVWVVEFKVISA